MQTRIIALFILLFAALTALAGNKVDNLFEQVKSLPNAQYSQNKLNKSALKGAFDGVKSIEVAEADIDKNSYQSLRKEIVQGDYRPYELLIDTQDDDELTKILMKKDKEKITEVVIIDLEKGAISLVRFKGNLKSGILKNR